MVAKRGRPLSDNSKDYMLRVRMNKDTLDKLDECCKIQNNTRSNIVRECIEEKYESIKK